jgi:hypothetical protein
MESPSSGKALKKSSGMTLEELVTNIMVREGIDREEDVSFIYEDGMFKVTVMTSNDMVDSNGPTLFLAFKKMYQKLYKEPVIEKPNAYFADSFENIIKKLSPLKQYIYAMKMKSGKWQLSMRVPFKSIDVRGIGEHWNHAITYMHHSLSEHGIDIKI